MISRDWLAEQVQSFETEAKPDHWRLDYTGSGLFVIPMLCFAQVEALAGAALAKVQPSTNEIVEFMRDFFRAEYRRPAALLYFLYRHGLVHQFVPKTACVEDTVVSWFGGRGQDRSVHLRAFSAKEVERRWQLNDATPGWTYLRIEVDLLYEDTVDAGRALLLKRRSDPALAQRVERAIRSRVSPDPFPRSRKSEPTDAEKDAVDWLKQQLKQCAC